MLYQFVLLTLDNYLLMATYHLLAAGRNRDADDTTVTVLTLLSLEILFTTSVSHISSTGINWFINTGYDNYN